MASPTTWHPVLAAQLLRAGHGVVAARLHGRDLALWRSASGQAQAWEDRCPHRGVRLTLGRVVGDRLACAYHGWEYAAGTGRCMAIPAMPREPVPGKVCARTYAVREAQAMVWVALDGDGGTHPAGFNPAPVVSDAPSGRLVRSVGVFAPSATVEASLSQNGFMRHAESRWDGFLADTAVRVFTQQADVRLTMLHFWTVSLHGDYAPPALFAQILHLRDLIEEGAP